MQPFHSLPADRQVELAEAADRDLSDPQTVHEIATAGRKLYGLVLDPDDTQSIPKIERGETLFNVGLNTFVRGKDVEEAFQGKPVEWAYAWLAKSLYGETGKSFSEIMQPGDPSDAGVYADSFIWHDAVFGQMMLSQQSMIGDEILTMIERETHELCQHIQDDFPAYTPVYRINDGGDYVSEEDWDAFWEKHSPWHEEVWMLVDNGDFTHDDVAGMTLGHALYEYNHDNDLYFENAFYTEWEDEEAVHTEIKKIDPNISVFVMGEYPDGEGHLSGGWLDLPAPKESIDRFMHDVVGIGKTNAYGWPCTSAHIVEVSGIVGKSPNWLDALGFSSGELTGLGIDRLNLLACCYNAGMRNPLHSHENAVANMMGYLNRTGLTNGDGLTFAEAANLLKQICKVPYFAFPDDNIYKQAPSPEAKLGLKMLDPFETGHWDTAGDKLTYVREDGSSLSADKLAAQGRAFLNVVCLDNSGVLLLDVDPKSFILDRQSIEDIERDLAADGYSAFLGEHGEAIAQEDEERG